MRARASKSGPYQEVSDFVSVTLYRSVTKDARLDRHDVFPPTQGFSDTQSDTSILLCQEILLLEISPSRLSFPVFRGTVQ